MYPTGQHNTFVVEDIYSTVDSIFSSVHCAGTKIEIIPILTDLLPTFNLLAVNIVIPVAVFLLPAACSFSFFESNGLFFNLNDLFSFGLFDNLIFNDYILIDDNFLIDNLNLSFFLIFSFLSGLCLINRLLVGNLFIFDYFRLLFSNRILSNHIIPILFIDQLDFGLISNFCLFNINRNIFICISLVSKNETTCREDSCHCD